MNISVRKNILHLLNFKLWPTHAFSIIFFQILSMIMAIKSLCFL